MVVGDGRLPALGFCLNEKAITTGHNHFRALYTSRWLGNLLHALGPRESRSFWHGETSIAIAASMDGWLSSQWNSSNARVIFRTKGLECSPRLAHLGREVDGYLFCEARDADARACLWYGCIEMWAIVGQMAATDNFHDVHPFTVILCAHFSWKAVCYAFWL